VGGKEVTGPERKEGREAEKKKGGRVENDDRIVVTGHQYTFNWLVASFFFPSLPPSLPPSPPRRSGKMHVDPHPPGPGGAKFARCREGKGKGREEGHRKS